MLGHVFRAADVAQVDDDIALHRAPDAAEIERAERIPFGDGEHRVGVLHGFGGIDGEEQALFLDVLGDEIIETRLVDRHDAGVQLVDLRLVLVHAGDDVAEIGKTGA